MRFFKLSSLSAAIAISFSSLTNATVITEFDVSPSNSAILENYDSIITVGQNSNRGYLEVNTSSDFNGVTSVTGSSLIIANGSGSSGTVKVDGATFTLNNGGTGLRNGHGGDGRLEVVNGGTFTANETNIYLGSNHVDGTAGTSTTIIDGPGSVLRTQQASDGDWWTRAGGRVYVGFDDAIDNSQVTITNGGLLEALSGQQFDEGDDGSILIGSSATSGSTIAVTVDGEGSAIKADNWIDVGGRSANVVSTLDITNGAQLEVTDGGFRNPDEADFSIGAFAVGGSSTVTVNGTGSSVSADQIQVGGRAAIAGYLADGTPTTSIVISDLSAGDNIYDRQGNQVFDESGNPLLAEVDPDFGIALPSTYLDGNEIYVKHQGALIVENNAQVTTQRLDVSTNEGRTYNDQGATLTVRSGGVINGDVNVYEGGELNGAGGTIIGDVLIDGGTLAPGNSPGTLHIDGNLELLAGVLALEVTTSEQDLLIVDGDAIFGPDLLIDLSFSFDPQNLVIDLASFFDVEGSTEFQSGFSLADNLRVNVEGLVDSLLTVTLFNEQVVFQNDAATTEVSAPSSVLLFGFSLAALLWVRRKNDSLV